MFGVVVLVVLALALLVAPALAAQSVNGDRERGTLATLQVTRLRAGEIALGKLLASWGTALVFLAVTLPLALWCYAEGGLSVARVAGVYLVTALLLGVVCAISLGLSALLARGTTLRRARVPDRVRARRHADRGAGHRLLRDRASVLQVCDGAGQLHRDGYETTDRPAPTGPGGCSPRTRSWCWPTPPRPARCTGSGCRTGQVVEEPRTSTSSARCPAGCTDRVEPRAGDDQYGTVVRGAGRRDRRPGLAARARRRPALAAGAVWLTTGRLRTPTDRLARGQRIA